MSNDNSLSFSGRGRGRGGGGFGAPGAMPMGGGHGSGIGTHSSGGKPPSESVDFNALPIPLDYVAGFGRGATGLTAASAAADADGVVRTFDSFGGYSGSLLESEPADPEQLAADRSLDEVQQLMDARRKRSRHPIQEQEKDKQQLLSRSEEHT